MTNNYVVGLQEYPQITGNFSGQAMCSNEDTGWYCRFNVSEDMRIPYPPIVEAYGHKCQEMGGEWNCYGWCTPSYNHYCDFRYKDGGHLCISSLQCGGKCAGVFGIGICSEYPLRFCDSYTEIFFGVPISNEVFCD